MHDVCPDAGRRTLLAAGVGALGLGMQLASSAPARAGTPLPPLPVIALRRLGFGLREGDLAAFHALGSSDTQRLTVWLDQQLQADSADDPAVRERIASANLDSLDMTLPELWSGYRHGGLGQRDDTPLRQTRCAFFLRACHSRWQLRELLVDFWHGHFSVYGPGDFIRSVFPDYDRVIRAEALGNFGRLLEATATHPAMLFYLDNAANSHPHVNENYARELLELHTMGGEHSDPYADSVPYDPTVNMNLLYTEDDVKEVARVLTGWTVADGEHGKPDHGGRFLFHAPWHDTGAKRVLGRDILATGMDEGRIMLDLLAQHPNTARFVCTKLCRRLIADEPPADVIENAARVFQTHWQSPDQIARVVRSIVLHPAFASHWGHKTRRPLETIAAALRAGVADIRWSPEEGAVQDFLYGLEATGQSPFGWGPPNGFPDVSSHWLGGSSLLATWSRVNVLLEPWNGVYALDIAAATWRALPGGADHTPRKLAALWLERILGTAPAPRVRDALAGFMAVDAGLDQPMDIDHTGDGSRLWQIRVRQRLQSMVALALMCPEAMQR